MQDQPQPTEHALALFGFEKIAYFRRVGEAALREARDHPGLRFRIIETSPSDMFAYPDYPRIHGVIAPTLSTKHLNWFRKRGARVILFSSRLDPGEIPEDVGWIRTDDEAVGGLAAAHFERMGLSHAAFFGIGDMRYSHLREQGFRAAWNAMSSPRGHYCACQEGNTSLGAFLSTLPKSCGILCSDDSHAKSLVTHALQAGYRIPEDFAVMGVDHDLLISELSPRRLSSVLPDAAKVGREAVRELSRCFQTGDFPGALRKTVPPIGVHYDESAPYYHSVNETVARALRIMESHLARPLTMEALSRQAGVSRRNLEYLFKKHLDQGPYQQLIWMRLHLAKRLLRHSQKNMTDIAEACGFTNAREFSVRFKEKTGQTPSQYREGE